MSSPMIIRDATAQDWPAVEALLTACDLPLAGAREHFADFIVCEDGGLVGCAGAEVAGDAALLRSVAVGERARGSGVGDRLTRMMLARLKARGVRTIALLTTTAETYFGARGFTVVSRDALPRALSGSAELTGACPATAVAMIANV
jgi:amino-acid N-acetyltransferase